MFSRCTFSCFMGHADSGPSGTSYRQSTSTEPSLSREGKDGLSMIPIRNSGNNISRSGSPFGRIHGLTSQAGGAGPSFGVFGGGQEDVTLMKMNQVEANRGMRR